MSEEKPKARPKFQAERKIMAQRSVPIWLEDSLASDVTLGRLRREITWSKRLYLAIKRVMDVVLALLLLIILSPLLAIIAIAIKLESPGPVLFVQKRVGKDGRIFAFYKFRSMKQNMDQEPAHREFIKRYVRGQVQKSNNGTGFKSPLTDKAITRVGKILRKTSLDELPQLINVLKGDMSLVGPRPLMDYAMEECEEWHKKRLEVLPGLTGLAQIHGRSSLTFDEMVRLDIQYVERQSLWLDLKILLKTIPVVLTCKDAG